MWYAGVYGRSGTVPLTGDAGQRAPLPPYDCFAAMRRTTN